MDKGIYIIICIPNGKIYVGSSKRIQERWKEHTWELKSNRHHSPYLQNAWSKYGEAAFEFKLVEDVIDDIDLINREQHWIDEKQSYNKEYGFNGRREADVCSWVRNSALSYFIRSEDGSEILIKNLKEFCRIENLNQGAMSAVARHKSNHHKGFHCRFATENYEEWKQKRKETIDKSKNNRKPPSNYTQSWKVIEPDGKEIIVDSLTAYCSTRGLSQGNMAEVARGNRKQHKGYKCEFVKQISHDALK